MEHNLRLTHRRWPVVQVFGKASSHSEVEVDASSADLTEAMAELLSRLPNDVYGALRAALGVAEETRRSEHPPTT